MDKDRKFISKKMTIYSFVPAVMFLVLAMTFAFNTKYTEMAIAVGGAMFGPAAWIYQRDLIKAKEDYQYEESKYSKILLFGLNMVLAGLAWMSGYEMITGFLLLVAFSQFWFIENPVPNQRMWHGLIAAVVGIWGFVYYRPVAFVFLALSLYFAYEFVKLQKKEDEVRKTKNTKKNKK